MESKEKEKFDPNFDSEFGDGSEFSSASASSSDSSDTTGDDQPLQACGGGRCGQPCTECGPHDDGCAELLVIKQCNLTGQCVVGPVDCTPPEDEEDEDKKKEKKKDKK